MRRRYGLVFVCKCAKKRTLQMRFLLSVSVRYDDMYFSRKPFFGQIDLFGAEEFIIIPL